MPQLLSPGRPRPDGGSPITSYVVTTTGGADPPGPVSVNGTPPGNSTTITGLTNGTAYSFTVRALNTVGSSAESAASTPVTPMTVPDAPTAVTAVQGDASATVSWAAPANTGGSPITSYTVTPSAGSTALTPVTVSGTPPATTLNVTGLTNGTTYTFTVRATNAAGDSALSEGSAPVTPAAPTAPAAPTGRDCNTGQHVGNRQLDRPVRRRQRDHQVHSHPVLGIDCCHVARGDSDWWAAGDDRHCHRPHQRHPVYLPGHRHQRDRNRSSRHILRLLRQPECRTHPAASSPAAGDTSASVSWSAPSNNGSPITGYISDSLHRDGGAGTGECGSEPGDNQWTDQWHRVYVPSGGSQRRGNGSDNHLRRRHAIRRAERSDQCHRHRRQPDRLPQLVGTGLQRWKCDYELHGHPIRERCLPGNEHRLGQAPT